MSDAHTGKYRCGNCNAQDHTRKRCPKPDRRRVARAYHGLSYNEDYGKRRALGLCGDCGVRSKHSRCRLCRERRKRWPSRSKAARKQERARAR